MAVNSDYAAKMRPYASRASAAVNVPVDAILAQWALESGNGTSNLARNHNNHGGIKYSKYSSTARTIAGSEFASYASLDAFTDDYIRVLKLSYYDGVRGQSTLEGAVKALGASPYDAGHYLLNGVQGGKLLNLLGLSASGATPGKPAAPAAAVCPHCQRPVYLRSQ